MSWWGNYNIKNDTWAKWQIGPAIVYAKSHAYEWTIALETSSDTLATGAHVEIPSGSEPDSSSKIWRFASGSTSGFVALSARLGDRPFVVRPDLPLSVLAGQQTRLYVSSVIWICAESVSASGKEQQEMIEFPALRPSDTWFGPNTLEGELCYASRSSARTDLDSIGVRAHRAITPVEISNLGDDTLAIEHLRIPVPGLALYGDSDDRLWTDPVKFTRNEGDRVAVLTTSSETDQVTTDRKLLASAREPIEEGSIVDAFNRFLG